MKKNKFFKFMISIFMMLIILSNMTVIFATSRVNPDTSQVTSFNKPMQAAIGVAQIITVGVALIILIALAIKYMSSATGDKAEIKKHAVVYIVGACIAFGATGILTILKQFIEGTLGKQ